MTPVVSRGVWGPHWGPSNQSMAWLFGLGIMDTGGQHAGGGGGGMGDGWMSHLHVPYYTFWGRSPRMKQICVFSHRGIQLKSTVNSLEPEVILYYRRQLKHIFIIIGPLLMSNVWKCLTVSTLMQVCENKRNKF